MNTEKISEPAKRCHAMQALTTANLMERFTMAENNSTCQLRMCPRCNQLGEFYNGSTACKSCRRAENRLRYHTDPAFREKANKQATESHRRNREKRAARAAEKYKADEATRKRLASNQRARYQVIRNDTTVMMHKSMSAGILRAIGKAKARSRWFDIAGYTPSQLREHLERQFLKGMTWGNHGTVWHVDHILPISSFDFSSDPLAVAREAWSLSNLRPLWKQDNLKKHAARTHLL